MSSQFLRTNAYYKRVGAKIALRAHHAGWLAPLQKRPRFTIWALRDVERVEEKLACGDYPPLLACEVAAELRRQQRKEGAANAN